MAQKISQMTEQTTSSMTEAGTSDFLGGYTATGGNANRKFSLSGLANYFLNKFKMTLGGSSQTVKSAIDALNSKSLTAWNSDHVVTDFNLVKTPGSYYCIMNSVSNGPSGNWQSSHGAELLVYYRGISARVIQVLYIYNGDDEPYEFVRIQTGESSWGSWFKESVRTEVDTLNSKTAYAIYNLKDYLIRTDQSTDTIGRIAVFGNVVMVSMQLGGLSLSVGENDIGSLSSFYPSWISSSSGDIFAVGTHGSASIVGNLVRLHLKSNGNISVVASTAQTSTLRVTFTYATSL